MKIHDHWWRNQNQHLKFVQTSDRRPTLTKQQLEIETLTKILKGKFGAKQIFLFGSYAYGNANKDSDLDLCVITNLRNKRKIDVIREIRRELIDLISRPMDILVYSENEFHDRASLKSTLEYKINSDGVRLYG